MNRILNEIKEIIKQNINEYLPEVKSSDLEENGTVYYMNGKNGTSSRLCRSLEISSSSSFAPNIT